MTAVLKYLEKKYISTSIKIVIIIIIIIIIIIKHATYLIQYIHTFILSYVSN